MGWRKISLFGCAAALTAVLFALLAADDPSEHLVFASWGTPTEVQSFRRLINHYNATRKPNHPVKLSHIEQNSYNEHLLVQAAARSLPDVVHLDRKDIPMFVHRGLLEDLTPFIESDTGFRLDVFLPALLPGCQVEGRFYGVPHNFSTLVLYYNKDHFDAEGLSYPDSSWTWDTFLRAALRLTKKDDRGNTVRYGCLVQIIVLTMMEQFGGHVLNDDLDSCIIASPESAEAFAFARDLARKYGVTWNVLAQSMNWDDMFAGGRLSMISNGRWAAAWYIRSMPPGALDVAPLPRGRFRRGASVNHLMTMSAESAKKDEAWEFIRYLTSEPAQRMVNEDGANIPALRSIVYSDEFMHHKSTPAMNNKVFLDELPHSIVWPSAQGPYLTMYAILSQIDLASRRIQLGEETAIQSLRVVQDNLNRVIAAQQSVAEPKPFMGSVLFYMCLGLPCVVAVMLVRHRRNTKHEE